MLPDDWTSTANVIRETGTVQADGREEASNRGEQTPTQTQTHKHRDHDVHVLLLILAAAVNIIQYMKLTPLNIFKFEKKQDMLTVA